MPNANQPSEMKLFKNKNVNQRIEDQSQIMLVSNYEHALAT